MTDPRIPDEPDVSVDDLERLGQGSLTDGTHPTAGQWAAVATSAGRRRQRHAWFIAAAAMIVLVVGATGIAISRSGTDSVGVSTGVGVGAAHWAIPPAGADVTRISSTPEAAMVQFTLDGRDYGLSQRSDPLGITGATTVDQVVQDSLGLVRGTPVTLPGIGTAYLGCAGLQGGSDDGSRRAVPTGPSAVTWTAPGSSYHLTGLPYATEPGGCGLDDPDPSALLALVTVMRYVDGAGWRAFLDEHSDVTDQTIGGVTVPASAPPTTLPEDPPADQRSAEDQIAAVVAGWDHKAADGTYPNLEDGSAKAAEYAEMFATAATQSGADQAADKSGNTTKLSNVHFVTPQRATITMAMGAVLPTGTFTFTQEGEAILQDGRWVVTYRTVTTTLGRACLPPGGYDGCPSR